MRNISSLFSFFLRQFVINLRSIRKDKFFTFINVFGLSVGLASSLIILSYIQKENSYDRFNRNYNDIYRINSKLSIQDADPVHFVNTSPALGPGIRGEFPELVRSTRLRYIMRVSLTYGDNSFIEDEGYYADSSFLEIFDYTLISGNRNTALDKPNSIILSKDLALKIFKTDNPVGQTLTLNRNQELLVTGIMEPVPENSHLQFNLLISFSSYRIPEGYLSDLTSWGWLGFMTYVELVPASDPKNFGKKLQSFYNTKIEQGPGFKFEVDVQPLNQIYFGSGDMRDDLNSHIKTGSKATGSTLGLIAFLILIIAAFNFVNLSFAKSMVRIRELGVRKVLGAGNTNLFFHIISEYLLITLISLLMAIIWIGALRNPLMTFLNFDLSWSTITGNWGFILLITILLGFATGIYPAIMMMRLNTVHSLKSKRTSGESNRMRNALVFIQFTVSICLITGSIILFRQIDFIKNYSVGFEKENILLLNLPTEELDNNYQHIREVLLSNPNVVSVSRAERLIGEPWPTNGIEVIGEENNSYRIFSNQVDFDFVRTLGIKISQGRDFILGNSGDSTNSVILNQSAVKMLGLKDPIGSRVDFFSINGPRTVIGVVDDFNFAGLYEPVMPMAFTLPFISLENLFIRTRGGTIQSQLSSVKSGWDSINLGLPFDAKFLDQEMDNLYRSEINLGTLVLIFTTIAIILSCLGLLALVSILVNHKLKEIAIRRVLGAGIISIINMVNKNYFLLILGASLLSIPLIFVVLQNWLNNFAFRISLNPSLFIIAPAILMIVGMLITSFRTLLVTFINPVELLKDE